MLDLLYLYSETKKMRKWASGWVEEESLDPHIQAAVYARYGLEIVGPPPDQSATR